MLKSEIIIRQYIRIFLKESIFTNIAATIIKKSSIDGVGIFANKHISADTDLGPAQILVLPKSYKITSLGKYHNHSYNPTCYNSWVENERHLFAYYDLFPGDEITVDYTQQPELEQPKNHWK